MSPLRKLIVAFWIFISVVLLWQFYSYNEGLKQEAVEHPSQKQFFFNSQLGPASQAATVILNTADVQQSRYVVEDNVPYQGSFTAHVTLKNMGDTKAVGVQIFVRPFRGGLVGDEDAGDSHDLDDKDPAAQFGQWVDFPDLAPNESSTKDVVFLKQGILGFGRNKDPKIVFAIDKSKN